MKKRQFISIMSLLSILTISGCTSYIPPNKPSNQLAYIKEAKPNKYETIEILHINGTPTHSITEEMFPSTINPLKKDFWINKNMGSETFPIEPGDCVVNFKYSDLTGEATGPVEFKAVAGKTYQVKYGRYTSGKWFKSEFVQFYVVDLESGKSVNKIPEESL